MTNMTKVRTAEPPKQVIQPLVNIAETEKEIILEAEMVGLAKEDVSIELKDDELIIHGRQRADELPQGYTALYRERCPLEYTRSFLLGDTIDRNKIDAQYENGILTVTMRKVEAAHPRKIEIK